jgi:RNA polymerase sigma factor (sigma-70 family)
MTDKEIIQGLIARDNRVTEEFFFVKCRPLFCSIMRKVFDYEVDYDEFVNELYVYLMENDASKLRKFEYRSTVYQWLKVLAIRFFIHKRGRMIDDTSKETPYDVHQQTADVENNMTSKGDIERLFDDMPNKRYVYVIRRLILDDCEYEDLAKEMNITTANLYNIRRRAMAQLTQAALKDVAYERRCKCTSSSECSTSSIFNFNDLKQYGK